MDAKTFENARWEGWDQPVQFRHRACADLIDAGSVLDVGCGDGVLLSLLKEKKISGEGIDFSPEAVHKCAEKGIIAQQHDLNVRLPYADASFDWVVALDVLEHQYDPGRLLAEMARVSKRNVIVGVPNFSSLPARLQMFFGRVPENNRPNKGHIYWFNYPVLGDLAEKAGLSTVQVAMNTFRPFSFARKLFPHLLPNLFALSFVTHFSKRS